MSRTRAAKAKRQSWAAVILLALLVVQCVAYDGPDHARHHHHHHHHHHQDALRGNVEQVPTTVQTLGKDGTMCKKGATGEVGPDDNGPGPCDRVVQEGCAGDGSEQPVTLHEACQELREYTSLGNPTDKAHRAETYRATLTGEHDDEWCAAFTNYIMAKTGFPRTHKHMAIEWLKCGEKVEEADVQPGDVAVYDWVLTAERGVGDNDEGHVGIVSHVYDDGTYAVLGGNQGCGGSEKSICSKRYASEYSMSHMAGFRRLQACPAGAKEGCPCDEQNAGGD